MSEAGGNLEAKRWWQSNTIRLGVVQALAGAATAYLTGEETRWGALVVAALGVLQVIQREMSLRKARAGQAKGDGDGQPVSAATD